VSKFEIQKVSGFFSCFNLNGFVIGIHLGLVLEIWYYIYASSTFYVKLKITAVLLNIALKKRS